MARMAAGSSMLATIRTAPPQCTQVFTSIPNTRLRRCAPVIARRFTSVLRGLALAPRRQLGLFTPVTPDRPRSRLARHF
jgi:hypothetical protein